MAKKKLTKKDIKTAQKVYKKMSKTTKIIIALLIAIILIGGGAFYYFYIYKKNNSSNIVKGELSIHFLELGNNYTGDCIYIKAGETDIIVDGGSRTNSSKTIQNYVNQYVTDGVIEYAIITHADRDHIACWAGDNSNQSLFDAYKVKTIIDFPKTDKTSDTYERYILQRNNEVENDGAVHYTALECYKNQNGGKREYTLSDGITLQILYNYYYENNTSDENNYSVCFMINQGSNHYLFTGDLETKGEEKLLEYNTLPKITLFKAGHHGSGTSSTEALLSKIQPSYIAITCVAGNVEYSKRLYNTFPYQDVIDRMSTYTDNVLVTSCQEMINTGEKDNKGFDIYSNEGNAKSLNGTIIFSCNENEIEFKGLNNSVKFKDSQWFKKYRQMPTSWQV